jgi:hypothetical protein
MSRTSHFPGGTLPDYSSGMTGIHASTKRNSIASARKSAVWLLQLSGAATAILIELALIAYVAYVLITQPSDTWTRPIAVATGFTVCLWALGQFVSWRMDRADTSKS